MPFDRFRPTGFGRVLLAKAQAGQGLHLTWAVLGDGVPEDTPEGPQGVVSERMRVRISGVVAEEGRSVVLFRLTNAELAEGFYYREAGLYASDPDTGEEGCYLYARSHGESEFIAGKDDPTNRVSALVRVAVQFSQTDRITFEPGGDPLYVLYEEYRTKTDALQQADDRHTAVLSDHEGRIQRLEDALFNDLTANPFMVRFDDLGGVEVTGVWNRALQRIEC